MGMLHRWLVCLSRIHRCGGFGIQSPADYAFVRYVVNEHWPYYAYDELTDDDWLTRKLGQLYLRLANWRRPAVMLADRYQDYWHAGCCKTQFVDTPSPLTIELARIEVEDDAEALLAQCDQRSVVVVEAIHRNWARWHALEHDSRVGTTFDLYYCGIMLFDTNRYKHHYKINF